MADGVKVKLKRTGRVRPPNLDNGALTDIGRQMVDAQKDRWSKAIDAYGNSAKKLSVRYAIIKGKYLRTNRPVRDMVMTGETKRNFALRKAINGVIRAENSTVSTRRKAQKAQNIAEMIGLAGSDQMVVFKASQEKYGQWLQKAWVPIG